MEKIKLSSKYLEYLEVYLKMDKPDLYELLIENQVENELYLLNDDLLSDIRDWAGDKLQKQGFDENYDLTDHGKILEDLIDVLYK